MPWYFYLYLVVVGVWFIRCYLADKHNFAPFRNDGTDN